MPVAGGGGAAFRPPPLVPYVDDAGQVVGRVPGCYANRYQTERTVLQICRNGSPIYKVGTAIGDVWGSDVWAGGCYIPPYGDTPGGGRDVATGESVAPSPAEACGGILAIVCGTNRTNPGAAPENYFSLCNKAVKAVLGSLTLPDGTVVKSGYAAMGEEGVDIPPGAGGGGTRQYRLPGWASFSTSGAGPDPGGDPDDKYDPSMAADFLRSRYWYQYSKKINILTTPRANCNQYTVMDTMYDINSPSGFSYNFTGLIKYDGQDDSHRRNFKTGFLPRPGAYVNEICGSNVAFRDHWGWTEPFAYDGTYRTDDLIYVPFYTSGDFSELADVPILQCMNTSWSPIDRPLTGWNAWGLLAICPPELVPYLGLEEVTY